MSAQAISAFIARATVDEMAAWLEARGIDSGVATHYIATGTWNDPDARIVHYRIDGVYHEEQATIRAAFAEAVRKVADQ